jgi:16S rRNA (adenine(1408)-N(1))-methyltransferase
MGTGDGRAALAAAVAAPNDLVIGTDANAAAMAEVSRRAAAGRTAQPNLLFAVAAAESPPAELIGRADRVRLLFPWGSLLRGALGLEDAEAAADGVAALVRPGGVVEVVLSVTERDRLDGVSALDDAAIERVAAAHRRRGLELVSVRPMARDEVRAMGSSWGRRLLSGGDRPVHRLELVRAVTAAPGGPSGSSAGRGAGAGDRPDRAAGV